MIPGKKFYGGFTTVFTDVVEDVTWTVRYPDGRTTDYSNKKAAHDDKEYYERLGQTVTITEKCAWIRCGEVQI